MRRLILRPGAIGDCILAFPAMEHLRASYTEVWISSPVTPLVHFADRVRPLSSTGIDAAGIGNSDADCRLPKQLAPFDSVISWYGTNRPEFRAVIEAAGVPCEFHPALPPPSYCGHAGDYFAEQVGAARGLSPNIRVQPTASRETIVIHPFSGSARKNWPLSFYQMLADKLKIRAEWLAGPEEDLAHAQRFDRLDYLASWTAGARLYIGNDSGITHLAAAAGMPVLALFGPTSPQVWGPRGKRVRIVHCNPLAALSVDEVLAAANRLLDSR